MHKITLRLTDTEYADLEARAETDRRTPKQMAEYLVTRPQPTVIMLPAAAPQIQPSYPGIWPPNVWSGAIGGAPNLNTYTTWKSPNICGPSGSEYPPLPIGTSGRHA